MHTKLAALAPLLLAGCLPTKAEPYHCTTDVECLSQTGMSRGLRCDLSRQVCVCDGLGALGCEKWVDGGSVDGATARPLDGPTSPPLDALSSDRAMCASSAACPATSPICSAGGACTACTASSQCAALGDRLRAACSAAGVCVECVDNGTCSTAMPVCDPSTNRCVQCLTSAACPATAPICTAGLCTPCSASPQCAALNDPARTLCSPHGGCVGCLTNSTCPATSPICSAATGTCTACTASAQCAALDPGRPVCSPTGACVQCTDNSTCSGMTPVCDVTPSKCVQCLDSAGCPPSAPICSAGHTCGTCATAAECLARDRAHPACSAAGLCVECVDRSSCSPAAPVCDPATNGCVQCLAGTDCAGTSPICTTATKTCGPCASSAQCMSASAALPSCAASGACVECTDNSTCSAGKPVCDPGTAKCVQCLTSANCSGATPICSPSRACAGCTTAAQCQTVDTAHPACSATGACVQCTDNSTCSGATPICNTTTNVCRACTADSECAGVGPGVCMSHQDGRCASDAETIVVASGGAFPSVLPSGKRVLVVRGSVTGAIAWSLDSGQITIVGQGGGTIAATGSTATVHLSGGDFYVRDLAITGGSPGLWADTGAVVRLDHVSVSNNTAGGILLDGAGFDISNTTVAGNHANTSGSAVFGGIRLQNAPAGPKSLAWSTISDNQLIGITCDSPAALIPTGVLVTANTGAVDIANCGFTSCGTASATCGAQP